MTALRSLLALIVVSVCMVLSGPAAYAASGTLTDARGDADPDIVTVAYVNANSEVRMSMTYADIELAQNESFWVRWDSGKSYQVFNSTGIRQLRYYSGANAQFKAVACSGLKVVRQTAKDTTKVTVPRSCLAKAPNQVRFQGIATMGLSSADETKVSKLVRRG